MATSISTDIAHFSDAPQQVLVTGGTGFIGRRLVEALLADGHGVTVLTRNPAQGAALFDGRVRCIPRMDALPVSTRVDVIVNLAGARILGWRWSDRWSEKRKQVLLRSRVGVTRQVVDWIAAAECKPRLMLSGSAIGYYGVQPRGIDAVLDEHSPPQGVFMSRLCREWEAAAGEAGRHGVKVVCMRFGLVMGQGGALPMMLLPIKLGLGGPLGDGRQWLSWIHVDDLLRALAFLWRRHGGAAQRELDGEPAAYNFTAPEAVTQRQFSRTAAALLHRPCCLRTPAWAMRALLGEQGDLLLEGQRVAPARLEREGFAFRHPTLREALRDLV